MNCPVCSKRMEIRTVKSVTVDVCPEHGMWLDRGELDKITESARQEGWGDGFAQSLGTSQFSDY